jgi:hypothetical protein
MFISTQCAWPERPERGFKVVVFGRGRGQVVAVAHAEGLVRVELRRGGWTDADLERRRKGDPEEVAIAWRLRQESAMTLKWIARCLRMEAWTHVSNCLAQKRKENEKCK